MDVAADLSSHLDAVIYFPSSLRRSQASNTRVEYLVDGFFRKIQLLLPYENNPYFIIPKDYITMCKSYMYWFREDKLSSNYAYKRDKYAYIAPIIIKQTQRLYCPINEIYPEQINIIQLYLNRFGYALCIHNFNVQQFNLITIHIEHLVDRGLLSWHFIKKIKDDPDEILRFLRQNRAIVRDKLGRKLDPSLRPSIQQLKRFGIIPVTSRSMHEDAKLKAWLQHMVKLPQC